MKAAVIDASVVLKWYLADEEHGQKAIRLLENYISNKLDLLAPSLLEYEVVNGLIIAQKRGRVKEEEIVNAIDGFASLEIKIRDISHLYSNILRYCKVYNCSAYYASYLSVAEAEGIPLITADEKLYNKIRKDLKWINWVGDV